MLLLLSLLPLLWPLLLLLPLMLLFTVAIAVAVAIIVAVDVCCCYCCCRYNCFCPYRLLWLLPLLFFAAINAGVIKDVVVAVVAVAADIAVAVAPLFEFFSLFKFVFKRFNSELFLSLFCLHNCNVE